MRLSPLLRPVIATVTLAAKVAATALLLSGAGAVHAGTILIMGDSLSAGYGIRTEASWVTLLQARLQREGYDHRIVNASISGETTQGGRSRLSQALDRHSPSIVLIELGGNDGMRGFPLKRVKQNLASMITASRERGAEVVLAGMHIPPNYGREYAQSFHAVYAQLAEEDEEVTLIPFFLDGVALNGDLMQEDGIHPNARAQGRLLETVWAALCPLLRNAAGSP